MDKGKLALGAKRLMPLLLSSFLGVVSNPRDALSFSHSFLLDGDPL